MALLRSERRSSQIKARFSVDQRQSGSDFSALSEEERLGLVPRGGLQEHRLFLLLGDIEIDKCRRTGMYDYGRLLYEKGGFNFEELGNEDLMEVEEDYQICVRRSS